MSQTQSAPMFFKVNRKLRFDKNTYVQFSLLAKSFQSLMVAPTDDPDAKFMNGNIRENTQMILQHMSAYTKVNAVTAKNPIPEQHLRLLMDQIEIAVANVAVAPISEFYLIAREFMQFVYSHREELPRTQDMIGVGVIVLIMALSFYVTQREGVHGPTFIQVSEDVEQLMQEIETDQATEQTPLNTDLPNNILRPYLSTLVLVMKYGRFEGKQPINRALALLYNNHLFGLKTGGEQSEFVRYILRCIEKITGKELKTRISQKKRKIEEAALAEEDL